MFLRGKKFVPERALLVMRNFMKIRNEMGVLTIADVANYLSSGVFVRISIPSSLFSCFESIWTPSSANSASPGISSEPQQYSIPDAVDKEGRKLFIVQARYIPEKEKKTERAHAMAYLLERDMNSPQLQRVGITTVLDMRKAPFNQNNESQKYLTKMLQDSYPIRVGSVLVVGANISLKF